MRRFVEIRHEAWIDAPPSKVRSQFADIQHHIDADVHPNLHLDLLAQAPGRARFTQEMRLLGKWRRDLFDRVIGEDGNIHDVSIHGFNKGATLDFSFAPTAQQGRQGTRATLAVRLPVPLLLSWLAPLLKKQMLRETIALLQQNKQDIERR